MTDKLAALEQEAKKLEPTADIRRTWNNSMLNYTEEFLDEVQDLPTFNFSETKGAGLAEFEFTDEPKSVLKVFDVLEEEVDKPSLNPAGPGHLGYIPGGGVFPTAIADYIAAVRNKYAGIYFAGPGPVRMENQLIRWMCEMVGYPKDALGNLASGGSIASLIAITTARDRKKIKSRNIEQAVIYLTPQVHHCIHKAIRIAGLGEAMIRHIPIDDKFRMDANYLEKQNSSGFELRPEAVFGCCFWRNYRYWSD